MIGAIAGDIIGSVYEGHRRMPVSYNFDLFTAGSHFTDDTVLMMAVAQCLVDDGGRINAARLSSYLLDMYERYPHAGYGGGFASWAESGGGEGYRSFGNGSAMRVMPVVYVSDDLDHVLAQAEVSAAVTHNHAEGIKGAKAIAEAIFRVRYGERKPAIKAVADKYGYDVHMDLTTAKTVYDMRASCQQSVPPALIAFLESESYEDCIRKAIMLGGDSDTIACMAGGIAGEYYGVPSEIERQTLERLDDHLDTILTHFQSVFDTQARNR